MRAEENARRTCHELNAVYVTNSTIGNERVVCVRSDGKYFIMTGVRITLSVPTQETTVLTPDSQ